MKKYRTTAETHAEKAFDALFNAAKRAELPVAAILYNPDGMGRKGRIFGASEENLFDCAATMLETFLQYIVPEGRAEFVAKIGDAALEWSIARDQEAGIAPGEIAERIQKARAADAALVASQGGIVQDDQGFVVDDSGSPLVHIPNDPHVSTMAMRFSQANRGNDSKEGRMVAAIDAIVDSPSFSVSIRYLTRECGVDPDIVTALLEAGYIVPERRVQGGGDGQ